MGKYIMLTRYLDPERSISVSGTLALNLKPFPAIGYEGPLQ